MKVKLSILTLAICCHARIVNTNDDRYTKVEMILHDLVRAEVTADWSIDPLSLTIPLTLSPIFKWPGNGSCEGEKRRSL